MHDAGLGLERHDGNRRFLGTGLGNLWLDRYRQRVVATVVATLDLDDPRRPVKTQAALTAYIVASVPELAKRSCSRLNRF